MQILRVDDRSRRVTRLPDRGLPWMRAGRQRRVPSRAIARVPSRTLVVRGVTGSPRMAHPRALQISIDVQRSQRYSPAVRPFATKAPEPERSGVSKSRRPAQVPARPSNALPGRSREATDVVLVVDDEPGFLRAAEIALERAAPHFAVHTVRTGGQAIAFLDRRPPFANAPLPAFIVLDFKLPDMTATGVLDYLRGSEDLRNIPVLVLTQAVWNDERQRALAGGASEFQVKPPGIQRLREVLASFRRQHVHVGQGSSR